MIIPRTRAYMPVLLILMQRVARGALILGHDYPITEFNARQNFWALFGLPSLFIWGSLCTFVIVDMI